MSGPRAVGYRRKWQAQTKNEVGIRFGVAVGLTEVVPFLLEDRLRERGGEFSRSEQDFDAHVVVDGTLVTGQNPASSAPAARELLTLLG